MGQTGGGEHGGSRERQTPGGRRSGCGTRSELGDATGRQRHGPPGLSCNAASLHSAMVLRGRLICQKPPQSAGSFTASPRLPSLPEASTTTRYHLRGDLHDGQRHVHVWVLNSIVQLTVENAEPEEDDKSSKEEVVEASPHIPVLTHCDSGLVGLGHSSAHVVLGQF